MSSTAAPARLSAGVMNFAVTHDAHERCTHNAEEHQVAGLQIKACQ